jgi:hypothetical protein
MKKWSYIIKPNKMLVLKSHILVSLVLVAINVVIKVRLWIVVELGFRFIPWICCDIFFFLLNCDPFSYLLGSVQKPILNIHLNRVADVVKVVGGTLRNLLPIPNCDIREVSDAELVIFWTVRRKRQSNVLEGLNNCILMVFIKLLLSLPYPLR